MIQLTFDERKTCVTLWVLLATTISASCARIAARVSATMRKRVTNHRITPLNSGAALNVVKFLSNELRVSISRSAPARRCM